MRRKTGVPRATEKGKVVARVVCDVCGDVEIALIARGVSGFYYDPLWWPDDLDMPGRPHLLTFEAEWALEGAVEVRTIDVACRRHNGWVSFDTGNAVSAARKGQPYAPTTIRARQHSAR